MTTYFRRESTCANCGKPSEHHVLGSTNAFGSADLDLRPPPMQRSTMNAWLQECPHCHYIAPEVAEREGDLSIVNSQGYADVLADLRYPELARRFLAHALLNAADPALAGHSRLRAAWVCDDAHNAEAATECRTAAAADMAQTKPFPDDQQGATRGAILVDVLRRAGQFEEADAECQELLGRTSAQGIIRQVLEAQRRLIAQKDTAGHTVAEVVQSP
jgi:hypothetical protein